MLLIGLRNILPQTVLTNGIVSLGSPYRRYCRKVNCIPAFSTTENSVTLNHSGIYHVTVTAVVSGTATGDVTLSLFSNGVEIPGATSTESITVATTQFRTVVIDTYVLVDSACVLGKPAIVPQTLTLVNTEIGATITNVVMNVEKVV